MVHYFQDLNIKELFFLGWGIHWQVLVGIGFGGFSALIALALVSRDKMKSISAPFFEMFMKVDLEISDIVFYSFCAGFGEELLFRAGIQHIFGIWPTAVFFVAIHGYLNPTNWRICIYGVLLVFVTAGFGYLYRDIGFFSAAIAHMVFDIVMFYYLIKQKGETTEPTTVDDQ